MEKKEPKILCHIAGLSAMVLLVGLIIAEIFFLKFSIAIMCSIILLLLFMKAFRGTGWKLYEIFALICVLNALVVGSLIIRDLGIIPLYEMDIIR